MRLTHPLPALVRTLAALTALVVLGSPDAHAAKIKDLSRETPRERKARDQRLGGNHPAIIALLDDPAMKQLGRKRTATETALLARSLVHTGDLARARKLLRGCVAKVVCARSLGEIELAVGDRRKALAVLGKAMKKHNADLQLRVAFGQALYAVGQGYQARQLLDPLADLYAARKVTEVPEIVAVARSLAMNGFFKDANDVLADANEAVAHKRESKLVEWRWAELFLSKSNFRDADKGFRKVLAVDPRHLPSIVGMARIDLDSDRAPRKAKKRVDKALKHAPKDPRLLALRAEVALHDEHPEEALGYLKTALTLSPTHAHALAVRYATCALLDDKRCMKKTLKVAHKTNRYDPGPHLKAARYLEMAHRYDRVLAELKQALKRDPDSAEAHAALGMSYARLADDKQAFAHLETAFRTDQYNVRTANVLNVLYDGVLKHMPVIDGEFVDLRVHRKHRRALERTMLPFLQESYEVLAKKYAMKAKQPLRVEVFPTSEQFSVRTVGLPQLGAHAVCFGHLITSRSPTERPFNWKMVLHHELAHVFHIQATDGRVPRWLTEGLAMMESVWLDARYHMIMERRLYDRLKAGKLAKVRSFNLAFSQARSMRDIGDAYYQAMKLTHFLDETYGFAKLRKLVAVHKSGKPTAALVKKVFGKTPEQLDAEFATWLGTHLGRFDKDFRPDRHALAALLGLGKAATTKAGATKVGTPKKPAKGDPVAAGRAALSALKKGQPRAAVAALESLDPKASAKVVASGQAARGVCAAHFLAMELSLATRSWKGVRDHAAVLLASPTCDGVKQRLLMARALRALKGDKRTEVLGHLRRAHELDPRDVSVLRFWLAALPKDASDDERRRLMRKILTLSPNDTRVGEALAAMAWKELRAAYDLTPPKAAKSAKGAAVEAPTKGRQAVLARDVRAGARQLEETTPHTFAQALWEAREAVTRGQWKMAVPVYRLAADRAEGPKQRRLAWCELERVAKRAKAKEAAGEASRRCKAERAR